MAFRLPSRILKSESEYKFLSKELQTLEEKIEGIERQRYRLLRQEIDPDNDLKVQNVNDKLKNLYVEKKEKQNKVDNYEISYKKLKDRSNSKINDFRDTLDY
jgi:predicted nuclease with TOPRIM domain